VWKAALQRLNIQPETEITYYEFGVFNGDSLRWWVDINSNPNSQFYGFDSFEGLPEPWVAAMKSAGSYKTTPGSLDDLDDRVTLVPGLFSSSVPQFFSQHHVPESTTKIVMFDADLFSSTVSALAGILMNVHSSDQLWIFDEFIPDEGRALEVFLKGFDFTVLPIASDANRYHVAFHIKRPQPENPTS
jgi:O-methyltransferase